MGVVLTFIAAAIQAFELKLHPVYFDHNAGYHVVQALGLSGVVVCAHFYLPPRVPPQ